MVLFFAPAMVHGATQSTGVINVMQPPPPTTQVDFAVSGTFQLLTDPPPVNVQPVCVNGTLWPDPLNPLITPAGRIYSSDYWDYRALLYGSVNGGGPVQLGSVTVSPFWDDLGKVSSFNFYVRLNYWQIYTDGRPNELRLWLEDIYGYYCRYFFANWPQWASAGVIIEKRFLFYVGQAAFTLQAASPLTQEGDPGQPLPLPLEVKVVDQAGNPIAGVGVSWVVIGWPGKSQEQANPGAGVSPASSTTGSDGKAQTTLTLGTLPGTYTVEARCAQCTSGSPQTFIATATAEKILSKVSGDDPVQEEVMEAMLPEPFVVKVEDKAGRPQSGVRILWEITRMPEGAQGTMLSAEETTTDEGGLSGVFLILGDTEGDYQVTATCPDCTQGPPQTFTAKAKCAIPKDHPAGRLSQCDPRWEDLQYDNVEKDICKKGCALTSLTMLLNFYGVSISVSELNDWLKENGGYITTGKGKGNLDWRAIFRYPGSPLTSYSRSGSVDDELRNGRPVILEVVRNGNQHFVLAFCKNARAYKIWDPADGATTTVKDRYGGYVSARILK
jgi:hypothetical protein